MRATTAYFAGGGTVIVAIVLGVGGGLLIADMVAPKTPKQGVETSRLERLKAAEPIQAAAGPSQPVPYLATTQARNEAVAATPAQPQPEPSSPAAVPAAQPQSAAAATPAPPAASSQTAPQQQAAAPPAASMPQPVTNSAPPATPEPRATAADEPQTRARETDSRRAIDRRKPERRQQWVENRRRRQQDELRAVEESVREETEAVPTRELRVERVRRDYAAEPARMDTPLIRLFGAD